MGPTHAAAAADPQDDDCRPIGRVHRVGRSVTLAGEPAHGVAVECLGLRPLAKGFGEQRLYRIGRSDG